MADGRLLALGAVALLGGLAAVRGSRGTVRDYGYETDPPGVPHRHRVLDVSSELDFDVCRCGFVRYPGNDWERSPGGLVRLQERWPGSRGVVRATRQVRTKKPDDPRLGRMTSSYAEAAVWSSNDGTKDLDAYDAELSKEARARFGRDCAKFLQAIDRAGLDVSGIDSSQLGHDFWLTRNRHGAGFWDRGLGELGQKLTDLAHAAGGCDLYVTEDEKWIEVDGPPDR